MDIVDPFAQTSSDIKDPFEGIVDPMEAQPQELAAKNTVGTSLKDVARFFLPMATTGINAIGTGIGEAAAGGSFAKGLEEGAKKEDILGFDLNMETSAGKWLEEKIGKVLGKVRDFGGEEAPKLLTNETSRNVLKAIPFTAPLAHLYDSLGEEGKRTLEASLSATGAAAPEVLLTLLGGKGASKLAKGAESAPDISIGDLLKELEKDSVTPQEGHQFGGTMKDTLSPDDHARLSQQTKDLSLEPLPEKPGVAPKPDSIDFEIVDPADLKTTTEDMFPPNMDEQNFRNYATPEQGRDFVDTIHTDITQPKGEPGQFDLPGINKPLGQTSVGKSQRGSIGFSNNASGESSASMEAINRKASQDNAGIKLYEVDPERNILIPLNTADRVDKRAGEGRAIVQVDSSGKMEVVQNNSRLPNEGLVNRTKRQLFMESGFAKSQRGSIGFKPEPQSLEAKVKTLSKEDWIKEFANEYPDKTQFAEQVYNTLNPKGTQKAGWKPSDSGIMQAVDRGMGSLSTRIGNISQPLLQRSLKFEQKLLENTHNRLTAIDDFSLDLHALPKNVRNVVDNAILNNDQVSLNSMFNKLGGDFSKNYAKARNALDEVGNELKSVGRLEGLRKDYFPRIVTDVDGLLNALGKENKSELQKRLMKASSPLEESEIINNYLQYARRGPYKPGFSKERKLDEVPQELQQFYASPTEAYHTYMRNATQEIETAKFFGRDAVRDPETKKLNLDDSIGNVILKEMESGKLDIKQAEQLQEMLQARFGPGSRASSGWVQDVKNAGYMGLLGDAVAAATQLGDPAVSIYLNGLRPTLMGVAQSLKPGYKKIDMKDFGLMDHISEEFVNNRTSTKALNSIFKAGLFTDIDRLGKNVVLNSSFNKAVKQVTSPQGLKKFEQEWAPRFGDEYPQLVADLQQKKLSEPVKTLLFSQLSKIQPITKLEMPQKYLEMPNGRILYMLKTFTLKQLDLVRNEAYNEIKKGNVSKGISNLAKYGLVMGLTGYTTNQVQNMMLGRDLDPLTAENVGLGMFRTFGLSQYVLDEVKKGNVGKAAINVIAPPVTMYDKVGNVISKVLTEGSDAEFTDADKKAVERIPIVGRFIYNWLMGGAEAYNEKEDNKRMKELLE